MSTETTLPDYYSRVNRDLLAAIPTTATTILEFGCGAGSLGRAAKANTPSLKYCGVEINVDAAQIAQQYLDHVVCANLDTHSWLTTFHHEHFDCFIYGDVLEHLTDPWASLKEHLNLLKPGGFVLACVPNIQHWSILYSLMRGDWQYQDEGLLDRTHLRFFTRNSLKQWFKEAGLNIKSISPRNIPISANGYQQFQQLMQPILPQMGINPQQFAAQSLALQYVLLAQKPMKIKASVS